MKKCFYFPIWEEQRDVMISLDNEKLIILNDLQYETPRDIGIDDCIRDNYTNKSNPSDPIFQKYPLLLELQKQLGFSVYSEYVVFEAKKYDLYKVIFSSNNSELEGEIVFYEYIDFGDDDYEFIGNPILELSKYYRGEENKWEEVKKVLNI